MKSWYPFIAFSLAILLFSAGCTTSPGADRNPLNTGTDPQYNLGAIALLASDDPYNVTVVESRQKQESEVSDLARNLGWEGGYIVQLETTTNSNEKSTRVSQNIAIYPEERMHDIMQFVLQTEKKNSTFMIVDLPDPGTGNSAIAFAAYKVNQTDSHKIQSASAEYYEIIFSKEKVLEVVRMSGPSADYAKLLEFAKIAYRKL